MKAAWSGHTAVVQLLLAANANRDARNKVRSHVVHLETCSSTAHRLPLWLLLQEGRTALMIAGREGHAAVIQLLVDAGADLNVEDKVSMPGYNNETSRPTATYDGEHRRVI
jgi:ankyrin repeat protein